MNTPNQNQTSHGNSSPTRNALKVVATVGGIILAAYLFDVLLMIFAGILLAVLLDGLTRLVQKLVPAPRGVALVLVATGILVPLFLIGWLFGPALLGQLDTLTDRFPDAFNSLEQSIRNTSIGNKILGALPDPAGMLTDTSGLLGGIAGVFSGVFATVANVILVFFVGIYGVISPHTYISAFVRIFPEHRRERVRDVIATVGKVLRRWLAGRFSTMVVVGVLIGVSFWIIGMPMAGTLGVITALLSFVPFLGPLIAIIPSSLVALVEGPSMIIYVLLVHAVVETLEGNIITPLIQLEAVSLPPAILISVQIVMGLLAGAVGVLLATPLAVTIIVTVQMLYIRDVLKDEVTILGHP